MAARRPGGSVELLTGTSYLLMLAIGMAPGALAAHAGAWLATELVAAAVVGGGAVGGWHLLRRRRLAGALADATTTPIIPANMSEVSGLIASAMKMISSVRTAPAQPSSENGRLER